MKVAVALLGLVACCFGSVPSFNIGITACRMEAYCTGDTVSVTASTGTAHTYQRNRVVVLSTGFSYVSVDASIVATAAVSSSTPVALVQNSGTGTVMKVTAQRDSSPVNTCAFVDNAEQALSVGVSTVFGSATCTPLAFKTIIT